MTKTEDRRRTKKRAQERKAKAELRDQDYRPAIITIDPIEEKTARERLVASTTEQEVKKVVTEWGTALYQRRV